MADQNLANRDDTITVNFHGEIEPLRLSTSAKDLTCEEVLQNCLQHVRNKMWGSDNPKQMFGPKYLPVFGLTICPEEVIWIPPNYVFQSSTEVQRCFKFRVRFRPAEINAINNIMVEYLLLQVLDDFMKGSLGKDKRLESKTLFHLVQLALIFPTKLPIDYNAVVDEHFTTRSFNMINFSKLFSKEIIKRFISQRFFDSFWVHREIKSTLSKFKHQKPPASLELYAKLFYKLLMDAVPDYCFEKYIAQLQTNSAIGVLEKVEANLRFYEAGGYTTVALYYGHQFQYCLKEINYLLLIQPTTLENVRHVDIYDSRGPSKKLIFNDEKVAQSFISMIQGCYNIYVNYNKCLCRDLQTVSSKTSERFNIFGPIRMSSVEHIFTNATNDKEFKTTNERFLIHESLNSFNQYDVHCTKDNQIGSQPLNMQAAIIQKSGTITLLKDLLFLLKLDNDEKYFDNFIDARKYIRTQYGHQILSSKTTYGAAINEEFQAESIPYYTSSEESSDKPPFGLPVVKEDLTIVGNIEDSNPLIRKYEVEFKDQTLMLVELLSEQAAHANAFREGLITLYKLNNIKPELFLKFYSIVLDTNLSVLMEYAPGHDAVTYICNNPQTLSQKIHIMDQIVSIMSVMDKAKIYHGNLRLRRFMVFPNENRKPVIVKLGDPGITSYLNKLGLEFKYNVERSPWLSPKRRQNLTEVTCEDEVYSLGTIFCELFYQGDNFHKELKLDTRENILDYLSTNKHLPCPPSLHSRSDETEDIENSTQIPGATPIYEKIWKMCLDCWNEDEEQRPTVHDLIESMKELKSMMSTIPVDTVSDQIKDVMYDIIDEKKETGKKKKKSINELKILFQQKLAEKFLDMMCIDTMGYRFKMGNGHYGTVWKIKIQLPTKQCQPQGNTDESAQGWIYAAAKRVKLGKNNLGNYHGIMYKEVIVQSELNHPNILNCMYLSFDRKQMLINEEYYNPVMMIMEFMTEGSLTCFVQKMDDLSTPQKKIQMLKITLDVSKGMEYLSGKGIVHRDLAARNVLVTCVNVIYKAKVSDFGLARFMEDDYRFYRNKQHDELPFAWMPPECLTDEMGAKFSSLGDVWSFGTVMWEAFSKGSTPLAEIGKFKKDKTKLCEEDFRMFYKSGKRFSQNDSMPPGLYNIMEQCWNDDPNKRPPFGDINQKLKTLIKSYKESTK